MVHGDLMARPVTTVHQGNRAHSARLVTKVGEGNKGSPGSAPSVTKEKKATEGTKELPVTTDSEVCNTKNLF